MRLLLVFLVAACAARGPIKVEPVVELAPSPEFEPPREREVVTETSIEIYETIRFDGNTAQITPASFKMIEAIAETLDGNPSIMLLQVRGHSDWEEPDRVRRALLSVMRAENVVIELIRHGVDPVRLQAYGASDSEPLSQTDPQLNRRIELVILQRASDN